jgi:hypothetical protein
MNAGKCFERNVYHGSVRRRNNLKLIVSRKYHVGSNTEDCKQDVQRTGIEQT